MMSRDVRRGVARDSNVLQDVTRNIEDTKDVKRGVTTDRSEEMRNE